MRVFLYKNLHRDCFSIKALEGKFKGKVIAHADRACLRNAEFAVSEAGRQRVLAEGQKNVHAGIEGDLHAYEGQPHAGRSEPGHVTIPYMAFLRANYDPYTTDSFLVADSVPVASAERVWAADGKIFVQAGKFTAKETV